MASALELSPAEADEIVQRGQQGLVLANDLRLQVLGPLEVRVDGDRVELNSIRQRTLLGLLALSPNAAVSVDALADAMCDGHAPPSAIDVVRTQVSRLRRRLQPKGYGPSVLVANAGGYTLRVETNQLDVLAVRQLADSALRDRKAGRLDLAVVQYRTAIELWRDVPLRDLPGLHIQAAAAELNRELETVLLEYADAALKAGRHAELLAPLRKFIDTNPLHELAYASLMTALARSGQRAAALELFETLRQRLAHDLGVDPGREVSEAYLAVLSEADYTKLDPVQATMRTLPRPAQLPKDTRGFAGREHQLTHLDSLLTQHDRSGAPIIAIHGLGGVGKSALAVHWAHRVAEQFPDGHLYADLGATEPSEVLRGFLIALGVSPLMIPTELAERSALYRSMLTDKRLLIVLDNTAPAHPIRSLLPGSTDSVVVVTSRHQMRGLIVAEGATPLLLDVMSNDEARTLLHRRIGSARVTGEPEVADEIIARCGRLPLALTLIAARAVTTPQLPLADIADQSRDNASVLDVFTSGEETTDLRSVFASTYQTLGNEAAALFSALGRFADPNCSVAVICERLDMPTDRVCTLLDELARIHFVTEVRSGEYVLHPLVHAYAMELAAAAGAVPRISDSRRDGERIPHSRPILEAG
ncbi:hypothetical protein GCM10009764_75600 [Nocardia ninae]|uniref:OmpR/PhoB-type domain-containing protein n=1 Tax=Nocardia ninae NBRC 108245 TaxID=1210091 RepID=A0A511MH76_9NOCA|nr:hypothetical protein NN4_43100 [Nocardia ninae NBRC 108245]